MDALKFNININNQIFSVILIYRLHSSSYNLFLDDLNELLFKNSTQNSILLGDINIDILINNKIKTDYISLLSSYGFSSIINQPTRHGINSKTCLDHVFIRTSKSYLNSIRYSVEHFGISDHDFITVVVSKIITPTNYLKSHSTKFINFDALNSALLMNDFNECNVDNPITAFNVFIDKLSSQINYHSFERRSHKKSFLKPWITNALFNKIVFKRNLYTIYKRSTSDKNKLYSKLKKYSNN